jgi:hypothetical protein
MNIVLKIESYAVMATALELLRWMGDARFAEKQDRQPLKFHEIDECNEKQ